MAQWNRHYNNYLGQQATNFEVVMIADHNGNLVGGANAVGTSADAFGRARSSIPLTLFDSSHRYSDNNFWNEDTSGTASSSFVAAEGVVNMTIGQTSGDEMIRETKRVFSYQPGKSLLIFNTFVMEETKANLRQRIGYFGSDNGIYVEQDDSDLYFVERSSVSGSLVNTRIAQADWNGDKLDGTGVSGKTLDITKAHIFWMDIEWLGVGSVRCGFVIDGELILCHTFHHANSVTTTYITTASLPLRYEITNTGATDSGSTLKQICSSIISEGGYELRGQHHSAGSLVTTAYRLTSKGVYYPVVSLRLKTSPNRLDAVAIITAASLIGVNLGTYSWKIVSGGTTTAGTWVSAGTDSAIEYNITGTSFTGGKTLASGFISSTNQTSSMINLDRDSLFRYQFERNSFTSTASEITLIASGSSDTVDVFGSLDWEEISR